MDQPYVIIACDFENVLRAIRYPSQTTSLSLCIQQGPFQPFQVRKLVDYSLKGDTCLNSTSLFKLRKDAFSKMTCSFSGAHPMHSFMFWIVRIGVLMDKPYIKVC